MIQLFELIINYFPSSLLLLITILGFLTKSLNIKIIFWNSRYFVLNYG